MSLFSPEVQLRCETILAAPIQNVKPLLGGDIHQAALIQTADRPYFIKLNKDSLALDMFLTEQKGLQLLGQSEDIKIPKLIVADKLGNTSFLLLEYIKPGKRTKQFWSTFGTQLANLHNNNNNNNNNNNTATTFGLDHHNYIGNLAQYNHSERDWPTFYVQQRLEPQLKFAIDNNRVPNATISAFQKLYKRLESLCPQEPATLIHGDLWSGNFLVSENALPYLIDPAVAYAHREMDIAMSCLFGGFDSAFYAAYEETYPLVNGYRDRMDIYQLYYLMVHVNLFGGSYLGSVLEILQKYA